MKRTIIGFILAGLASSALAVDKAELDSRIRKLTVKFEELQQKSDKRIPADNLRKAQGIVLLDRTKAGFIFAFQGGGGVAMVKNPQTEQWSPVVFLNANEGSLGFQIGGQKSFVVILLMNTNATRVLTEANFDFGGEARGTAGDSSAGAQGTVSSPEKPSILVYGDRSGLYAGATIKGGDISPNDDADSVYYSRGLTAKEILFDNKVKATESAVELAAKITEYSKK